jgi:transcriptional regulator with XRE-family HTH domain
MRLETTLDCREDSSQQFYESVQETFVFNVIRALRVAGGVSETGEVLHLQKGALASRSGLSKGTVTKITSSDPREAKPDLETICKLAYALNISPAFLLMTSQDWELLLQAFGTMQMFSNSDGEQEQALIDLLERSSTSPDVSTSVRTGLEFMGRLQGEDYSSDRNNRQQIGILAMTAMAQAAVRRQSRGKKVQATALAAMLGNREVAQF